MQVHDDISESAPFLVISDNNRINVFPVLYLHEGAPATCMSSWTEVPHATVDFEFPLEKWVHIGCEVCYVTAWGLALAIFFICFYVYGFHFTKMSFALY